MRLVRPLLWRRAADSIPEWLPMRHFDALEVLYRSADRYHSRARGRSNLYLVLLDYRDWARIGGARGAGAASAEDRPQ